MKKVLTFISAIVLLSAVSFGQSNEDFKEKVKSLVDEMNQEVQLTQVQQDAAIDIFADAYSDLSSSRSSVKNSADGDKYMEQRNARLVEAFNELKAHVSNEQYQKLEAYATERGLLKK